MRSTGRILFAVCAAVLVAASPFGGPCEMNTVEKGFYCARCDVLLQQSSVKGEACPGCKEKVKACEICVRAVKPKDGGELRLDKARIVLRCEGCRKEGDREGACPAPACVPAGKRILRMCSKSGTEPHATP